MSDILYFSATISRLISLPIQRKSVALSLHSRRRSSYGAPASPASPADVFLSAGVAFVRGVGILPAFAPSLTVGLLSCSSLTLNNLLRNDVNPSLTSFTP